MKSLYENAMNGAMTVLNYQINKLEKEKDKAIKALEKERDAQIKVLEDQRKALEKQKKALEDQIKEIEKEKEAVEKANEERERNIELQKAQWQLERSLSQRTRLTYKNGQMEYTTDNKELRDAKEGVRSALYDKEIAEFDKKIDGLNDQVEELEDQIDDLNEKIDEINEHYDELIKQTEEFYDAQIEALQDILDMWEEFQAQMELADALKALDELGYKMEDVLSGNPEMFADITGNIAAITGYMNDSINQVAQATGMTVSELKTKIDTALGYPSDSNGIVDYIDELGTKADEVKGNVDNLSSSLGNGTGDGSGTGSGLASSASSAKEPVEAISKALGDLKDVDLQPTAEAMQNIAESVNQLNTEGITNLVTQFTTLKSAIEEVATALGVGGSEGGDTSSVTGNTKGQDSGGKKQDQVGSGLIGGFQQLNETDLGDIIAQVGGDSEECLRGAVNSVSKAFGGGTDGDDAIGEGNTSGLIGAIEQSKISLGDSDNNETLIGRFNTLHRAGEEYVEPVKNIFYWMWKYIGDCVKEVRELIAALSDLEGAGEKGADYAGTVKGMLFAGTAYAKGNWSAKSHHADGDALVGELGQELVVHPNGRFETVGDNGAEFRHIGANDIVFNHKQTEELLKNGHINSRGKAYAGGKDNVFSPLSAEEMSKYTLLDGIDNISEKLEFGNQKLMNIDKNVSTITTHTVNNNNSPVFNIDNTFTCNGVSLEDIQRELANAFSGIFTTAYQRAMR